MPELTDEDRALINAPNAGHLGYLGAAGQPVVTPVWIDLQEDLLIVNCLQTTAKLAAVRRDPRVAVEISDRENHLKKLSIQGRAVEVTDEGAEAHIDRVSAKYIGQEPYPWRQPGDHRWLIKIKPERLHRFGY
jgi:PPOX class probable F420-dependent enzyme